MKKKCHYSPGVAQTNPGVAVRSAQEAFRQATFFFNEHKRESPCVRTFTQLTLRRGQWPLNASDLAPVGHVRCERRFNILLLSTHAIVKTVRISLRHISGAEAVINWQVRSWNKNINRLLIYSGKPQ